MIDQTSEIIERFKNNQIQGNLAPCWILKGEPFIGKSFFAKTLAKNLLYKNSTQDHGLPNLVVDKQIDEGIYPNFLYVSRLPQDDGSIAREINAEQAKKIKTFLQKKPAILGWRIVIVDSINDLNRFGANSLLKILEEPPSKTGIFLICHQLGTILPTIRSRCQILNLTGKTYFFEENEIFVHEVGQNLERYFKNDASLSLETTFKNFIAKDKNLNAFRHILLKMLHSWISDGTLRPAFFAQYSPDHWVNAFDSVNNFFILSENAHLDPFQSLTAIFTLLKKPQNSAI